MAAEASGPISYPSFPGIDCSAGLTCEGDAGVVGGAIQLTWSGQLLSGAAFSAAPMGLGPGNTFSTTFDFAITKAASVAPADGFTFVLAANPNAPLGVGGSLGYAGMADSIAIEFDTYDNGGTDDSGNHIGLDTDGLMNDSPQAEVYNIPVCDFSTPNTKPGCLSNGQTWTANITYDGSELTVSLFDPTEGYWVSPIDRYAVDLPAIIGSNLIYAGFTAATGSGVETFDILSWTLGNGLSLQTPEPGIALLFFSGLCALLFRKTFASLKRA